MSTSEDSYSDHHINLFSEAVTKTTIECFVLEVALVMVFLHSHRTITNISGLLHTHTKDMKL